jgi:hypothetical protein
MAPLELAAPMPGFARTTTDSALSKTPELVGGSVFLVTILLRFLSSSFCEKLPSIPVVQSNF